jgi:hypothetical protein
MIKGTITKIETVNGGQIWTVTIRMNEGPAHRLNLEPLESGEEFSSGEEKGQHWFNFWEKPVLSVGDQLTDDEAIIADQHGSVTETTLRRPEGPTLEEVWCEKHGLKL